MKHKKYSLLLLLAMVLPATVLATPRGKEQMRQAAQQVFSRLSLRKAPAHAGNTLSELHSEEAFSIYGYREGGFVVVAADDVMPAILGYSDTPLSLSDGNTNFRWFLSEVTRAAKARAKAGEAGDIAVTDNYLDKSKYPEQVAPMVTAKWGQEHPYWLLTPVDDEQGPTLTGCVAVAMAQVMHHWRYPLRGSGTNTVYYPYYEANGTACTVNFGTAFYNWDAMLDVYKDVDYTDEQADAVATLMYHCGVGCYMQYGTSFSGAYMQRAADGLRKFFGYPQTVKDLLRSNYDDQATWMDILYGELAEARPLLYGGEDRSYGGHAFVIDGYDADGLVHVNWGWEGKEDGFYNIAAMEPSGYKFNEGHEMVVGIVPEEQLEPKEATLTLAKAGQLESALGNDKYAVTSLKVSGALNSDDIRTLREMAGRSATNMGTRGVLYQLDLSEARIVSGGSPYLIEDEQEFVTADNALPERMFSHCEGIATLTLPASITEFGAGAFGYCYGLENVVLPEAPAGVTRNFQVTDDGLVMSLDGKEVIGAMPMDIDTLRVPEGVERLRDYALAGDVRHEKLVLPSTLTRLGTRSLDNENLTAIKVCAKTTPRMSEDVFGSLIPYYCMLYVPAGCKTAYSQADQWKNFRGTYYYNYWGYKYDNIREFGAIIKVRNASRAYGEENPEFGFQISGAMIHGDPVLSCEATPASPVGRYAIVITKGTVTDENVEFENGYLNVMPAVLKAKAKDCTRYEGQDNPVFEIEYTGLKNGDTDADFYEKPVVTTTATKDSPQGEYLLVVSGGDARNYDFEYETGTLTILDIALGIGSLPDSQAHLNADTPVYSIGGQRVATLATLSSLPAGVYVVNGQKVVRK